LKISMKHDLMAQGDYAIDVCFTSGALSHIL
jgi:hypothetical protein